MYRKIPKISLSKYKPPKTGNLKNPQLNRPSKYKPPGGLKLENCPQIQSKTTINLRPTIRLAQSILSKFPSVDKPLRIQARPKISPSKRVFEKCKPRGLFSEFYGILKGDEINVFSYIEIIHSVL